MSENDVQPVADLLPVNLRLYLQAIYAVVGVVVGCIGAYFASVGAVLPEWYVGVAGVVAFLAGPIAGLSAVNIRRQVSRGAIG